MLTEWSNRIKRDADEEWLTASQRRVYDQVTQGWRAAPFVCICGHEGSGKSFIARLLAKQSDYFLVTALSEVGEASANVIVDGERYHRLWRPVAQMKGIRRVIVLSRTAPLDPMPVAQLALGEHDVRQFKHNLTKHKVLDSFAVDHEGKNLWQILMDEAFARGGVHNG